ncbi:PEP-CTERM sorting domain-containing protein [Oxalobacteraceae bacterium A2-2]
MLVAEAKRLPRALGDPLQKNFFLVKIFLQLTTLGAAMCKNGYLRKLSLLALLPLSMAGHAEVLQYNFVSHATSVEYWDRNGPTSAANMPAGAPVSTLLSNSTIVGSFFVDTSEVPTFTSNENVSFAAYSSSVHLVFANSGGYRFDDNLAPGSSPAGLSVIDGHVSWAGDGLGVSATHAYDATTTATAELFLSGDAGVFADTSLPRFLPPDRFTGSFNLTWRDGNYNAVYFYTTVDSVTLAVPEPATYSMLGGGLLLLGAVRSRRRKAF